MFIRLYFVLVVCLNGVSLLGKVPPLNHAEIIHFRSTQSAAISAEKNSLGTAYDAVAILSLANQRKADNPVYYSRLVQGVCLGYGFKNGVQSSLVPSAVDRSVFQESLETAGEQLLSTSALPTGAAVWNIAGENHNRHAQQMAEWLRLRRAGTLDMEYIVLAARYPTAKLLNDASLRTPDPEYAGQNLALTAVLSQLQIDDHTASFDGLRLTNISSRADLYQGKLCQVCHCHPYNNFDTPISPLAIEYLFTERFIPGVILSFIHNLGIADAQVRFYLNVQENQGNSKQILLRPHALFWMFPNGNKNYAKAGAFAIKDNGEVLVDEVSSVCLHDDVASPGSVMVLDPGGAAAKFSSTQPEAFYSLVVYGGRAAITRHIFITNAMRDLFQVRFQQKNPLPSIEDFLPLLTVEWKQWFIDKGILPA